MRARLADRCVIGNPRATTFSARSWSPASVSTSHAHLGEVRRRCPAPRSPERSPGLGQRASGRRRTSPRRACRWRQRMGHGHLGRAIVRCVGRGSHCSAGWLPWTGVGPSARTDFRRCRGCSWPPAARHLDERGQALAAARLPDRPTDRLPWQFPQAGATRTPAPDHHRGARRRRCSRRRSDDVRRSESRSRRCRRSTGRRGRRPRTRSSPAGRRALDGLQEQCLRLGVPAVEGQRQSDIGQNGEARRIVRPQQCHAPAEQAGRGGNVKSVECPAAGGDQGFRSPPTERPCSTIDRRELDAISVGLLEVEADQLLDLVAAISGGPLQPVGEALVEVGSFRLGQPLVGGLANEHVAESERVAVARGPGARGGSALPDQRRRGFGGRSRAVCCGRQGEDRRLIEHTADDRRALGHGAALGLEPIQARREQAPGSLAAQRSSRGSASSSPSQPSAGNDRPLDRRASPRNSSTNSGLPSAASMIRLRTAPGRAPPGTERIDQLQRRALRRAARAGSSSRCASRRPRSVDRRTVWACRTDEQTGGRGRGRRRTRGDRAASARPNGCLRPRRRLVAPRPAVRGPAGTPRTDPPGPPRLEPEDPGETPRDGVRLGDPLDEQVDPLARSLGGVAVLDAGDLPHDLGHRPVGDAVADTAGIVPRRTSARPRVPIGTRPRGGSCPRPPLRGS